jgi:hypothetical protein
MVMETTFVEIPMPPNILDFKVIRKQSGATPLTETKDGNTVNL